MANSAQLVPIVLETDRLIVRHWVPDDWKRLRPLATDPRVLKYIGDGQPWSDERLQQFVNGGIEQAKIRGWLLWPLIYRPNEELIGFAGFNSTFEPEVEIGWWLLPDYWGKGWATEGGRAWLDYGFRKFEVPRVISVAQPANAASIRVMEKLGMHFERRFVHDETEVVCYAISNPLVGH